MGAAAAVSQVPERVLGLRSLKRNFLPVLLPVRSAIFSSNHCDKSLGVSPLPEVTRNDRQASEPSRTLSPLEYQPANAGALALASAGPPISKDRRPGGLSH